MSALKVLETNVLHASDVIHWLDGSSAEEPAAMLRLQAVLHLQLTSGPADLRVVNGLGKTAFLRRPTTPMIDGVASPADTAAPVTPTFAIAGVAGDAAGRYVPRRFAIDAGNAAGHGLVLYPSPLGSRFGPAGGLLGTLRFTTTGEPVPWALLTLTVTTALGASLVFRGQAGREGDFMLPLTRLPPLPEGIANHAASLAVAALETASASEPVDPADLVAMQLGRLTEASFADDIALTVVPGEIRLIRSFDQTHLAVQPT